MLQVILMTQIFQKTEVSLVRELSTVPWYNTLQLPWANPFPLNLYMHIPEEEEMWAKSKILPCGMHLKQQKISPLTLPSSQTTASNLSFGFCFVVSDLIPWGRGSNGFTKKTWCFHWLPPFYGLGWRDDKILPAVDHTHTVVDCSIWFVAPCIFPSILDGGDPQDDTEWDGGHLRLEGIDHGNKIEHHNAQKVEIGKAVKLLKEILG